MSVINFEFRNEVFKHNASLSYCYQCSTCTGGCPVALLTMVSTSVISTGRLESLSAKSTVGNTTITANADSSFILHLPFIF